MSDGDPKTVFVIGAGSSISMGGDAFPSGPALLAKIGALLAAPPEGAARSPESQFILELIASKFGGDGVSRFRSVAARMVPLIGTHNSIDQLITNAGSEEVALVGKVCIAYLIGAAEAGQVALSDHRALVRSQNKWLIRFIREYLARARNLAQAEALLARVRFVVFNYDRLVEHLLCVFLGARFELTADKARQVVEHVSIEHPYGQLAPYRPVPRDDGYPIGYRLSDGEFYDRVEALTKDLRTFGESVDEAVPQRIRDSINLATNLIFVGFGFGGENLELILPQQNSGPIKNIFATNTGINTRRWQSLEASVLTRLSRSTDTQRTLRLHRSYTTGRINVAASCEELIDQYSLEW